MRDEHSQAIAIEIRLNEYLTGNVVSIDIDDINVRLSGDALMDKRLPFTLASMMGRINDDMYALMLKRIAQGILASLEARDKPEILADMASTHSASEE